MLLTTHFRCRSKLHTHTQRNTMFNKRQQLVTAKLYIVHNKVGVYISCKYVYSSSGALFLALLLVRTVYQKPCLKTHQKTHHCIMYVSIFFYGSLIVQRRGVLARLLYIMRPLLSPVRISFQPKKHGLLKLKKSVT